MGGHRKTSAVNVRFESQPGFVPKKSSEVVSKMPGDFNVMDLRVFLFNNKFESMSRRPGSLSIFSVVNFHLAILVVLAGLLHLSS